MFFSVVNRDQNSAAQHPRKRLNDHGVCIRHGQECHFDLVLPFQSWLYIVRQAGQV